MIEYHLRKSKSKRELLKLTRLSRLDRLKFDLPVLENLTFDEVFSVILPFLEWSLLQKGISILINRVERNIDLLQIWKDLVTEDFRKNHLLEEPPADLRRFMMSQV